ncbi:MAG: serine/threonine protein kinase [Chloroflexaceae bacterium]|nr:serine/threonine protein kinase [Chloroflexaceae bacterium]
MRPGAGSWRNSSPTPRPPRLRPATAPPADDPAPLEPPLNTEGQTVGRYVLAREIGQGGMATVYLAYDPATRRRVAIKVLAHELAQLPGFAARLREEAETVAALEHEGIVQVYDVGEHAGQPFIVMQYLPGGTLAARLHQGPLSLRQAAQLLNRLAEGLDAAHRRQIVHQDIKPSNILFDEHDHAFLSDFGIAVASRAIGGRQVVGGTPRYMSPEQARLLLAPRAANDPITPRSDVYALGVVLFQVLTGRVPYDGVTISEIAQAQIEAPVPRIKALNAHLPEACQEIINRALAKDPADRYAHATDLAHDVHDLTRGRWYLRRIAGS